MSAATHIGRVGGLAVALGIGAAIATGQGVASAAPDATDDSSATSPENSTAPKTAASTAADPTTPRGPAKDSANPAPSTQSKTRIEAGAVIATGGANTAVRTPRSNRAVGHHRVGPGATRSAATIDTKPKIIAVETVSSPASDVVEESIAATDVISPTHPEPAPAPAAWLLAGAARRELSSGKIDYEPKVAVDNGVITGTNQSSGQGSKTYTVIRGPSAGGKVDLDAATGDFTFLPNSTQLKPGGFDQFRVLVSEKSPLVNLLEQVPVVKYFVAPIVLRLHQIPIVGTVLSPIIGAAKAYTVDVPVGTFVGGDPIAFTTFVTSFDGTRISVNYFPKVDLGAHEDAPTILNGPSLATAGYTDPNQLTTVFGLVPGLATLRGDYNVVTWDPRGEFASGGRLHLDSENFEAKDVSAIISWVARQPGTAFDPGTNDRSNPLIGMVGGSYGGGIQLTSAGIDTRIDAISPGIAWNSLNGALYPNDAFKTSWASLLLLSLVASGSRLDPEIYSGILTGVLFGRLTEGQQDFLSVNSPAEVVDQIKVPTLFLQGTVDTLFPLDQAMLNAEAVAMNNQPVKMIWYCGGHGQCLDPVDLDQQTTFLTGEIMEWMDTYVLHKGDEVADDPQKFTWVDQDGDWYASSKLPIDDVFYGGVYPVPGSSGGLLPIVPVLGGSGPQNKAQFPVSLTAGAEVEHGAINLAIPDPQKTTYIVGAPKLTLTYSGIGTSRDIYAQLVDTNTHRVVGNIVSPIPVKLDGKTHTETFDMEDIAYTFNQGDQLELQIVGSASSYEDFTSLGVINVTGVGLTLPTANAKFVTGIDMDS